MTWVFSAFVVLWNLRAIEGPASADLWPNGVFTKITPRESPRVDLSTEKSRATDSFTIEHMPHVDGTQCSTRVASSCCENDRESMTAVGS